MARPIVPILLFVTAGLALLSGGCREGAGVPASAGTVVVYTALDQVYSEPILKAFEERTGIRVEVVYDAESAKTTGLVNRLIARRDRPDCDVWWNNEPIQTARLAERGLLEKYESPAAARIPAAMRDPQGRWTGFAARMRVLIYNTNIVKDGARPAGLEALVAPEWRGKAAIALSVAAGRVAFGLTDTDDAYAALREGKPVAVLVPDAGAGAILMPNTVAVVAGCPHREAARRLIDYLLSAEVERRLAEGPSAQIPLGTDLADVPTPWGNLLRTKAMDVDFVRAAADVEKVVALLQETGMDR